MIEFYLKSVYNIRTTLWGSFRFDCEWGFRKSMPKARLCKNGNFINAESNDSKVIAFPSARVASLACAA